MSHLDEGTIQAWLDGELSPVEGASLEAHAAACTDCAARIAESRGLMAASSRILAALDEVPGAVLPTSGSWIAASTHGAESQIQSPAVPKELELVRGAGARRSTRRPFYRHPQFAAAAAVLVVVVGTWTVAQRTSTAPANVLPHVLNEAAASSPNALLDSAAFGRASAAAEQAQGPPPAAPSPASPPPAGRNDAGVRSPAVGAASQRADNSRARDVAGAGVALDSVATDARERRNVAPKAAEPPAPPTAVFSPLSAGLARAQVDSTRSELGNVVARDETKRLVLSPDSLINKERDRLAGELSVAARAQDPRQAQKASRPLDLSSAVVTGAAVTMPAQGRTAASCYDLGRASAALEQLVPPRIQLLETRGPTTGERRWKQVQVLGEEPGNGAWFWWTRSDGAILLARVEGTTVRYEVPITGPTAQEVRAYPQRCP